MSAGKRFKSLVQSHSPLRIVGVPSAYVAKLAEEYEIPAIYLSGAGLANSQFALPDLGVTNSTDVVQAASAICASSNLPLLVDIDTGWDNPLSIDRAVKTLERIGCAGVHLEDQANLKRCGHRDAKSLCTSATMVNRIQSAVAARADSNFVVMARTDALANEPVEEVIVRLQAYVAAGADMIFVEAIPSLDVVATIKAAVSVPMLINLTEFGKTPTLTLSDLAKAGVEMALYPLSVMRCMHQAARAALAELSQADSQAALLPNMETREALYQTLDYERLEALITEQDDGKSG